MYSKMHPCWSTVLIFAKNTLLYNHHHHNQDSDAGDFPGDPVAKTALLLQGAQVWSLVRELDPTCHNWELAQCK